MALSTSTNGTVSGQVNTQSPQASASSGSPPTTPAKNVQPGTANSLLAGSAGGNGISLGSTALPVISLPAQTVSQAQPPVSKPSQHHPNVVLLAIVIVLFVMAILAFWMANRSAKNTTNY